MPIDEIGVLLVRQRLDRRRVEAFLTGRQCEMDGELSDGGLAGSGWSGDQDAVSVLERRAGLGLEGVKGKWVRAGKRIERRSAGLLSTPRSGISLRRRGHRSRL